jgi:hypothetical protein
VTAAPRSPNPSAPATTTTPTIPNTVMSPTTQAQ